jgi:hypothetical protein
MNLSGDFMKYGNLIVLIRHDSAEIWVFGYSIALGLGTFKKLRNQARTLKVFFITTSHDFDLINIQTEPWLSISRFGCRKLVYQGGPRQIESSM